MAHAQDFVGARELLANHRLTIEEEAFWEVMEELGPVEQQVHPVFDSYAFCQWPRIAVHPANHHLAFEADDVVFGRSTRLFSLVLDKDGWVVLATGDWRWIRLREPFDLEVQESGFVLWGATEWRHMFARPTNGGVLVKGYVAPEPEELEAVENGVPIAGYVDADQFPLLEHSWSPAAATGPKAVGLRARASRSRRTNAAMSD